MRKALVPFMTHIIMNFRTIIIQYRLLPRPYSKQCRWIFTPRTMQGLDFFKQIKDPAVINRVGHIQTHDM